MSIQKQDPLLSQQPMRRGDERPAVNVIAGFDAGDNSDKGARDGKIVYTQTRVLGVRPEVLRSNRLIVPGDGGPAMAAYRQLRTQVLLIMRKQGWSVLGVTSPRAGEGKTVTAINLAISMAMDINNTVLLADLDLRHPSVHRHFDVEPGPGLSDYLRGALPSLGGMFFNPGIDRMIVLPGGAPLENSSEMLSSPRMTQLAGEMKRRYASRIVLFDLPPLLSSDDTLAFSPQLDAILMVSEDGRTKKKDLDRAADLLKDVPVIGPVMNKSRQKIEVY